MAGAASPLLPTRTLAGRNHKIITNTPTVEATPDYSDGDVIGGKQTLTAIAREDGGAGAIVWGHVYSLVDIGASIPIRVLLFNANPSASTFTENSALSVHANDLAKIIGILDLSQRLDLGTPVVLYAAQPVNIPFECAAAADDLYAVAVAGGTINLGTAADLTFVFGAEND